MICTLNQRSSLSPTPKTKMISTAWAGLSPQPVGRYHFDIRLKFSIPPGEFESPSHP